MRGSRGARGPGCRGARGPGRQGASPSSRWVLIVLAVAACRGTPPGRQFDEPALAALVDSLRPVVEQAVGLEFRGAPRLALTTRDAVRSYLLARVEEEFPPRKLRGMESAYQLLGLLPDTLDLQSLILDLYTEQVAGYYDPQRTTLYAVQGGDPTQLRLVLAHELVHALQHDYLPLDSLMQSGSDGDRAAAVQAVLEGHATVASVSVLAPGSDILADDGFWETYQDQVRAQQEMMPLLARSPLVLRESMLFPYLSGADFMRWWARARGTPLPEVGDLPRSTEQVMHPDRLAANDTPVPVRFTDEAGDDLLHEDTFGELECAILLAALRGAPRAALDRPLGWGGDRYRVVETDAGTALVWYSVWDAPQFAERFAREVRDRARAREGYRLAVEEVDAGGRPGVRFVHAPEGWTGWRAIPAAATTP